nr:methyl-accepting chemotaxis protein [Bacillus rubiinfantis]
MEDSKQKRKGKRQFSIRFKWITFICLATVLAVGVSFAFNYWTISKILTEDNTTYGKSNVKSTAALINLNLQNYQDSINQLADILTVDLNDKSPIKNIEKKIAAYQAKQETLLAVYYMDFTTGKLHISPQIDMDIDVRDTQTYERLKANPKTQWMDVYEDKDQHKIMTSIVAPVLQNGKMIGAIGYDIDLSTIGAVRKIIEADTKTKLIILDSNGFIVSSFIKDADGKNINPAKSGSEEGVEDLLSGKKFTQTFGWIENVYKKSGDVSHDFTWKGKEYSGEITTISGLNWKVLSFTPKEIFVAKIKDFQHSGIIAVLLGLVVGGICAIFLAERLKKLIMNFQKVIEKTAQGDLVTEISMHSNDEIGEFSRSYNEMLGHMNGLIKKVEGNAASIEQATNGLSIIAKEHDTAIKEVSRAIEEIALGAGSQSEQINKGTNAVLDLSREIEELSKQSTTIEQEVDEASERIKSGNEQVENLEASYQKLEGAFEQVTNMVAQLNEKSQSISNVTDAIARIAEQTNLLSLNASIEAARAGEHGRGFSVVANEVRVLAEESKKATENIKSIINSVLEGTNSLVTVMGETNQISAEQKGAVNTVSQSIDKLTDSLNKIMLSVKDEASSIDSIQEQKDVVVRMIEEISSVSQQTSAATEEIAAAMEEQAATTNVVAQHASQLAELVEDLNTAVGKFQTE